MPAPRAGGVKQEVRHEPKEFSPDESLLLKLMFASSKWVTEARANISPEDLKDPAVRLIVDKIYDLFVKGQEVIVAALVNAFDDSGTRSLLTRLAQEDVIFNDQPRMFADCLRSIKGFRSKERRQRLREEIKKAEMAGNGELVRSLQEQFNVLIRG